MALWGFPISAGAIEEPLPPTLEQKIETLADKYEVSASLAEKIIWCESNKRPNPPNNKATKVGRDSSYWQINSHFWTDTLAEKGWDINNPEHNLEAGFWILSTAGTTPWTASKKCWKNPNLTVPKENGVTV